MKAAEHFLELLTEKKEPEVKIPFEPGALGHSLDASIDIYKSDIENGKKWSEMSKQITTLTIFNKNKNPGVSTKASNLQKELSKWVGTKRKENPEFGK